MTALKNRAVDYKALQLKEQSNIHSIHDPLSFKDIDMSLKVRHRKMSSYKLNQYNRRQAVI